MRLLPPRVHCRRMQNERPAETPIGAFDETILPHLDAAHNLSRWLMRGSDEADDVVQEACLRALRYFATFRGGNARAWLLRIVRTTAFRRLQQHRAQQSATEFDEEIHDGGRQALDPETLLIRDADTQLLEQAMNQLPVRLREVLLLRELEGFSYKEIAEVVGVPMGTVMSALFRARGRLRAHVNDLVRRQMPPAASTFCDAELQETSQDVVSV